LVHLGWVGLRVCILNKFSGVQMLLVHRLELYVEVSMVQGSESNTVVKL
jgi:hypothetical protein